MTPLSPNSARLAGLDGLRAVAVTLVVAYHLLPGGLLPGGFVGVDVFFVISGFLITSLLLRERGATGRLDRAMFWRRRARRLLPALGLMLVVVVNLAALVNPSLLYRVWEQVLGAVTFSYNWIAIASQTGYFGETEPELFRHVWSLAVEEQFYLLWPLVLPLVLLIPRGRLRLAVVAGAAAASAIGMAALTIAGSPATRGYFGTDTHLFGILLGAALALALAPPLSASSASRPAGAAGTADQANAANAAGRAARWVEALGGLALLGIIAIALVPEVGGLVSFPGVLAGASVLTAITIAAASRPGSRLGRWMDVGPLRWVGERSYGIYLWHWPLAMLWPSRTEATLVDSIWRSSALAALTLIVAGVSFRYLEQPIRRNGFRGALRNFRNGFRQNPVARFGWIVGTITVFGVVGGGVAAVAFAPTESDAMQYVQAGERAVADSKVSTAKPTPGSTQSAPSTGSTSGESAAEMKVATPDATGAPDAAPVVTGAGITAVGDSVMLAAAPALASALPGISIDAAVSRSMGAAPAIVQADLDAGALRDCLVIGLGTNGPIDHDALEEVFKLAGPNRDIIFVTAFANRGWIPGVNADLAAAARSRPRTYLADWSGAIAPHADVLASDGIHPGPTGGSIYAATITGVLDRVAADRVDRALLADRVAKHWLRQQARHAQWATEAPQ